MVVENNGFGYPRPLLLLQIMRAMKVGIDKKAKVK
jgi:hypothetical protein